jgi:hypothetical protein
MVPTQTFIPMFLLASGVFSGKTLGNYRNSNVDSPQILVLMRSYPASPSHTRAQSVKRALELQINCISLPSFLHTSRAEIFSLSWREN